MKTWNVEIQRVKAMSNSNGLIRAQIDALVQPAAGRDEGVPTTLLQFSEETARVMLLLLKTQLAEFDARKAKSRR
ncbi:MAG: hypothetical protein ABI887_11215 [Burkholderiales bacterium]